MEQSSKFTNVALPESPYFTMEILAHLAVLIIQLIVGNGEDSSTMKGKCNAFHRIKRQCSTLTIVTKSSRVNQS